MVADLSALCIQPDSSIRQAIACIDRKAEGIVLVVDEERHLIGTITDGDIRRAILGGINLDLPVQNLLEQRAPTPHPSPLTAPVGTPDANLLQLMNEYLLRHIPIVDEMGRVVDVALLSNLVKDYELPLTAVVMAGGYGSRLRPLTEEIPKPMLPVGDRPLLEWIIQQLRRAGILRVNLTTYYKGELIAEHFGDGRDFGVEINYVNEDQPLGTAGALSLLEMNNEPLLVINGDILTQVDFGAMLAFHREHQADMTVAIREYNLQVPYGVIVTNGVQVTSISEKPLIRHFINAGIYLLGPAACRYIPDKQHYDMTELITHLTAEGRRVVGFPIHEYWLDIGQMSDFEQAKNDVANGHFKEKP